jgi:hypothetical protein
MRNRSVAEATGGTDFAQPKQLFGMRDLQRVAIWGIAAASALTVAAFASTTAIGIDRLMQAAGQLQGILRPASAKALRPLDAKEGERLAESVRRLSSDRERLAERIDALEHSLENITGSIARISKAAGAASRAEDAPPALPAISPEAPPVEQSTANLHAPAPAPAAAPAPAPATTPVPTVHLSASAAEPANKSQFALDIGAGGTMDGLRALWAKARQQHGTALDGLRPLVHVREGRRAGAIELRLVAGPLPSAVAAARLCAKLNAAGTVCQPALFEGQRLAVR